MQTSYLLGVDIGTSGTKTVLFDTSGTAVASATVEYPLYQPKNGWAEQEPDDWWDAAVSTIRSVLTQNGVDAAAVAGIGLSGQMHGLVMLDEAGFSAEALSGATGVPLRNVRKSPRQSARSV